ncbi:hypothetical protein AB0A94_01050 [Streptomyces sp. NPDC044984]|uniref:hypothetical protein n=1 Tax=Streptomyces sp. NPDC044984 TaxID=3154335 RepID=UPI0033DD88A8
MPGGRSHHGHAQPERFARFFEGLEVVGPGIVAAEERHPEFGEPVPGQEGVHSGAYVAVARKA